MPCIAVDGSHGGESGLNIFVNDVKRVMMVAPAQPILSANVGNVSEDEFGDC